MNSNLITLKDINLGGALKSNLLSISNKNPNQSQPGDKILLQEDKAGAIVDSTFIFTVDIDVRPAL